MASIHNVNTCGFATSDTLHMNCFDIHYQNVRGLRTKQLELYDNVCSTDHNIICLTETWLNHLCYNHSSLHDCYTVFCSDRDCVQKTRGGGVLTAVSSSAHSCKCRCHLESWDECVWIEVPTHDGLHVLLGIITSSLILNLKLFLITFYL
jgi:hypothetical protein